MPFASSPLSRRTFLGTTAAIATGLLARPALAAPSPPKLRTVEDGYITSEYYMPMPVYLITGAIYFLMAFPLSLLANHFERRSGNRLRRDLT